MVNIEEESWEYYFKGEWLKDEDPDNNVIFQKLNFNFSGDYDFFIVKEDGESYLMRRKNESKKENN